MWNAGAERMYGWSAHEVLGRRVGEVVDAPMGRQGARARGEVAARRRDGSALTVELTTVDVRDADGQLTGFLALHRDVTARKRELAEWARRQAVVAELGQRALAGARLQGVMDDAAGIVARALEAAAVGIAEIVAGRELLLLRAGTGWRDGAVGTATAPAARTSLLGHTVLSGAAVSSADLAADERFEPSALTRAHALTSAATVVIAGEDEPFGALGAFSRERRAFSVDDVNFLQGVANAISIAVGRDRARQRMRGLRDAERRRISRALHDEPLQELTEALALASAAGADGLVPALERAAEHVRGAIRDLRLDGEERPFRELLEDVVQAQRALWPGAEIVTGVSEAAPVDGLGDTGAEVLRVVREALVNARRHSGAGTVHVDVWGSGTLLCAAVSDDGRGFDAAATRTGIAGMRERAAALGGELEIRSERGAGTRIALTVHLDGGDAPAGRPVRVLLVEDHAAVRQAIGAMLAREPDFAVVGLAASMAEARGSLRDVDVAVIDLGLPDGYGGDLIKELRAANRRAQALVLSASLDRGELARAVASGAAGTLHKTAQLDVRRLRAGETLLPMDEVVDLLRFAGREREREHDAREAIASLTAREREVLQALADGLESRAIADRLNITIRTERNHVANILAKLGVHSQLQAVVFALRYETVEIR
jgi:DNA-binding NarL/FixJ family response regulator/signal transduction histidine kinase